MLRFKTTLGLSCVLGCALAMTAGADTHYVAHGTNIPSGTYTSWATAASNIQDAVGASANLDTVLVSNGLYNAGGTASARVEIGTKNIALLAVSTNPYDTVIDASAASCCVYVLTGGNFAQISGFVITNGYRYNNGGGILALGTLQGLVVSNCVIEGNSAVGLNMSGGGVYSSTANKLILKNCVIRGNSAYYGGGASQCLLTNDCQVLNNRATNTYAGGIYYCTMYGGTIAGNQAKTSGSGGYWATLYNVVLTNNSGCSYGGAIYNSSAYNCWMSENSATYGGAVSYGSIVVDCVISNNTGGYTGGITSQGNGAVAPCSATRCIIIGNSGNVYGGGAYGCFLTNCLIAKNRSTLNDCSGAQGCSLVNCTVVSNQSLGTYAGVYNSTSVNSIAWGNIRSTGTTNNYSGGVFTYSCATPLPAGDGNIATDPQFANAGGDNYRLAGNSPCIDSGTNQAWMTGDIDLDRGIRLDKLSDRVDMGAYEYMHRGVMFSFR